MEKTTQTVPELTIKQIIMKFGGLSAKPKAIVAAAEEAGYDVNISSLRNIMSGMRSEANGGPKKRTAKADTNSAPRRKRGRPRSSDVPGQARPNGALRNAPAVVANPNEDIDRLIFGEPTDSEIDRLILSKGTERVLARVRAMSGQ